MHNDKFYSARVVCCLIYNYDDMLNFIQKFGFDKGRFAYILHDKDKDNDGNLKPKHYHLYAKRNSMITAQSIDNFCKSCNENLFYENLHYTDSSILRYLIHKGDLDKYQYDINDVVCNFDLSSEINKVYDDKVDISCVIDMLDSGVPIPQIVRKFPKLLYSIGSLIKYRDELIYMSKGGLVPKTTNDISPYVSLKQIDNDVDIF